MNLRFASFLSLVAASAASLAQYSFTQIDADSEGRLLSGAPALNNAGQIAYQADTDNGSALYRYSGGIVSTLADASNDLGFIGRFPTINASGQVGFAAQPDFGSGIFQTSGAGIDTISGAFETFDFIDFFPSMNAAGRIAFRGEKNPGFIDGIYAGDSSGPVAAIYDENGPYGSFGSAPSLNDANEVAFTARRDSDDAQVLLFGNGATPQEVATDAGELSFIDDHVDLNNLGDVAFRASLDDGSSAIFRYRGGSLTSLVDTNGSIADFSGFAINDLGSLAFVASLDDGTTGLFAGNNLTNPLLSSGTSFMGKTLFGFGLSGESLNDNGELAFLAFFEDGSSSLVAANPVPEPASLAALGLGAAALLRRRRQ